MSIPRSASRSGADERHALGDCALDLSGVRVQVDSAGAGCAVKIIASRPSQAKEVLRRAELLRH